MDNLVVTTDQAIATPAQTQAQTKATLSSFIDAAEREATKSAYTAHAKLFQRYLKSEGIGHPQEITQDEIITHVCKFAAWLFNTPAVIKRRGDDGLYQERRPRKLKSIQSSVYGVVSMLRSEGFEISKGHPTIKKVMKGVQNRIESSEAERISTPKDAARLGFVQDILSEIRTQEANERARLQSDFAGDEEKLLTIERRLNRFKRDAALVSWFMIGAFRRSELGHVSDGEKIRGMDIQHIERTGAGYRVRLPIMKQDKAGIKYIPPTGTRNCPVKLMEVWLSAIGAGKSGPAFPSLSKWGTTKGGLSGHGVNYIVKHWLRETLKRDFSGDALEAEIKKYASHSFRRGFVTEARAQGYSNEEIGMRTLQSDATVSRYVQADKMEDEAMRLTINL